VAESKTPRIGGESVLSRFSELMFVDVVRRYLETLPADRTGWLTGLRHPSVGRALTALDRSPNRDWTVGSLAREVGLSRSVLAERFTQFVGPPAMQYLTNWRMQLAANHLLSGADSIATVADRVGYESEAAFSRAFKKWSECLQASGGGAAVIDAARSGRGLCYWPPALPSRSAEGRYSCETLTR